MESACRSGRPPRLCRASMARTTLVVQRATTSWSQIFGKPAVVLDFKSTTCAALAKEVKKFLAQCPSDDEAEILAFQSIKKLLPASCRCMEGDLLRSLRDTLTKSPTLLPAGYIAYVKKRVSGLFRKGWDTALYSGFCYTNTPGLSATTDSSRLNGGCMSVVNDQVSLWERSLGEVEYETAPVSAQLIVVQSAGKPRALTKFSSSELVLRPLHKSIYEHLSRVAPWLCRGDPTSEKLAKAGFAKGKGILVSGDYRSATDNLSLEVAEAILDAILDSSSVPMSVRAHARAVLRPTLWNLEEGLEFEVSRGQMMGSYLSFPLLCLQNFLSFDYARQKAKLAVMPLLINGDDILFQSPSPEFPREWMDVVAGLGLEVEESKTSVSYAYGTLNSTLFGWKEDSLVVTPSLRFGMLRPVEYVNSLGSSFHSFVRGQPPGVIWRAARTFFSWHLASLKQTRLFPDEMGFRGSLAFRMSRIFGLLGRDLSIVTGPPAPIPHNVVLSSDQCTLVPEAALSDELKLLNDREMASWKFSIDYQECRTRAALRYCLALSSVRRPVIDYSGPRWRELTDDFSWRRIRRKRFYRPLVDGEKMIPVFDSVLQTQSTESWINPPTYTESVGEFEVVVASNVEKSPSADKSRKEESVPSGGGCPQRLPDIIWT